jgi:succinoglycan biosynthesis protein ExoL
LTIPAVSPHDQLGTVDDRAASRPAATSALDPDLIYFAPDFTEVATIARARAFFDHGFRPAIFAFRRGRYNCGYQASWLEVDLGRTRDGRYLHRAAALCRALPVLWAWRQQLRAASVFYARNLDQLALALVARWLAGRSGLAVYEVLDVAPALTDPGRLGRLMRLAERLLLRQVGLLVVSSPGFLKHYYVPAQGYRGPHFVLENKLYPPERSATATDVPAGPVVDRGRYRWVVGCFGLIRGQTTFDLITRLAERLSDEVLFYFRGVVTTVDPTRFAETIARHDNMVYGGPYVNPDDLAALYGAVDLVWALDFEHEDANSRWLMPCRFYEAGAFGVPCLAARGFQVGDRIDALGVGWTFEAPYEDAIARFFGKLDRADYGRVRANLARLPRATFIAGDDVAALCRLLGTGPRVLVEPAAS